MTKAEITGWSRIVNETVGSREIYAACADGLPFGGLATIEKIEVGRDGIPHRFILMIDRGDRRRRTISVLETMEQAQAAAASLIAK